MEITPERFIKLIQEGKSEFELNRTSTMFVNPIALKRLTSDKYGHSVESAKLYLTTDYSNGFTICKKCGSFYHLGYGFTKHISNGCLNCEGESKHRIYHVNSSLPKDGGFPARYMSIMFDDGMSYVKSNLEIGKYSDLFTVNA